MMCVGGAQGACHIPDGTLEGDKPVGHYGYRVVGIPKRLRLDLAIPASP